MRKTCAQRVHVPTAASRFACHRCWLGSISQHLSSSEWRRAVYAPWKKIYAEEQKILVGWVGKKLTEPLLRLTSLSSLHAPDFILNPTGQRGGREGSGESTSSNLQMEGQEEDPSFQHWKEGRAKKKTTLTGARYFSINCQIWWWAASKRNCPSFCTTLPPPQVGWGFFGTYGTVLLRTTVLYILL